MVKCFGSFSCSRNKWENFETIEIYKRELYYFTNRLNKHKNYN